MPPKQKVFKGFFDMRGILGLCRKCKSGRGYYLRIVCVACGDVLGLEEQLGPQVRPPLMPSLPGKVKEMFPKDAKSVKPKKKPKPRAKK